MNQRDAIVKPTAHITVGSAERARMDRVDQLVALGEQAVRDLLELLTDPSWSVRRAVVAGLAALGPPAVAPLCQVVRNQRAHEGQLAAAVDALVGSTGHVEQAVVALTRADNPAVVADAAQILGRRRASSAIPVLINLTRHPDDNVSVAAVEALGHIGGRAAVESLIAMAQGENFFRTFPAIDVLGRSGDPRVVPPLSRLLDHPHLAPEAARALGRTGERSAAGPLIALLIRQSEALVRVGAVALAELMDRHAQRYGEAAPVEDEIRHATRDGRAARQLAQSIGFADTTEKVAMCRVLGEIDSDDAVAAVTRLLEEPEPITSAAAAALRRIGERSESEVVAVLREGNSARRLALLPLISRRGASPAVVECLTDPDPVVRAAACDALARMGDPHVVPDLFHMLGDVNPRVLQAAVGAIQALGSIQTERLALAAARDQRPDVRRAAFRILAYFGYPSALPLFIGALEDQDSRVRDAAIRGLPYFEDPGALDALLELARSPGERIRAAALRALGHSRNDVRVSAALLRGLGDSDPWARYFAAQSLGRLLVERASPALARLLEDPAGQVRVAAIEALSHLRGEVAFAALRGAAGADDLDVQRAALIGLGISRRPEALPILLEATVSPVSTNRLVAISALAEFDSPDVLWALERAAADPDESVRNAAIGFLAGRSGHEPTAALVRLLARPGDRERVVSALSVFVYGRIDVLLDELAVADDETAPLMVSALVRTRRSESAAALARGMGLANPAARKAVAAALPALRTHQARAALQQAASHDVDPEVRRIAALGLE